MAKETAKLHQKLFEENKTKEYPQLWLVGYSELKNKGIFTKYKEELKNQYSGAEKLNDAWKNVFVFQHFSMNRFTIDLGEFSKKNGKNLPDNLKKQLNLLGTLHKEEIF